MSRRAAIQDGYKQDKHDAPFVLTRAFYEEAACPFAQAAPGTLSFKDWLEWSNMRVLTRKRDGVYFPARRPSLLLWYASYAHAVSVMGRVRGMSPTSYHEVVTDTLEALKAKKDRAFKLHIVRSKEGDRKHQLFHRLFGKNQREPMPFEQRVYVPVQFFMHTWKSISIDNSTFRLCSALPELYWVHVLQMGQKNPFVRLVLSNNVDVTNAYIMDLTTLEDVDVECAVDQNSEPARIRTHADAYARDLLGVSNGVRRGKGGGRNVLPKLERLRLKNATHLMFLPSAGSLPVLDVLQLEGLAEADPQTLVLGLGERINKIRIGNAPVAIGPPRHLSIINCAIVPDDPEGTSDIEHWITVGPRTEVLELGGPVFSGMPAGSGGNVNLKRLALFETDNLHFVGIIRLCRPQELVLQDLEDGDAEAGEIADVLHWEKIQFTSASFVNTGITDFSQLLRGQALLETLTISDAHLEEGAQYSIPYEDLRSLREQRGFLALDDRMVHFTPGTAAKFRARTATLEAREAEETAAQLGIELSVDDDAINSDLDRQTLSQLPPPFRWRDPGNPDNVMLPAWISSDYYTKMSPSKQREVLHNWALWAAEMNDWVCGADSLEGFHFSCNMIDNLYDVVREDVVRGDAKAIRFEWKLPTGEDDEAIIEREALDSLLKKGVFPLSLRLVRRPRQLTGALEPVPGIDMMVRLDTESLTGHMHLEPEDLALNNDILTCNMYVRDKILGQRYMLCSVQAKRDIGADFEFPLDALVSLFSTCAVVDMMMAARAYIKQEAQESERESDTHMALFREFANDELRNTFPGLVKMQIALDDSGRRVLRPAAVELVGKRPDEDRQSAWEQENRERLQQTFAVFSRMIDTIVSVPLSVGSAVLVRLAAQRAEMSECMSMVCLMGMGLGHMVDSSQQTPLIKHIASLSSGEGVIAKMMRWLLAGRPVHSEHVVHGTVDEDDDEESSSSSNVYVAASQPQSMVDRIVALVERFYTFHQATDEQGDTQGLLWLFQQDHFGALFDVLIGSRSDFVLWKGKYDSVPTRWRDDFRLAQFEWDLNDVRSECMRLAQNDKGALKQACELIASTCAKIDGLLNRWKSTMAEVVQSITDTGDAPESDIDPRWSVIKTEFEKRISLNQSTAISKEIYTLLDDMQDHGDELQVLLDARILEQQATIVSARQPSPQRSPMVESPVKNQRLVSPAMLSEPPPPPVTVFQSPEQAAQKPQKKKLKLVIDEEEEEEEVRLYGEEEELHSKRKTGVQVIVTRPQERIVINLLTPETSPEKPARYAVVQKSGGDGSERRPREFTPPRKEKGTSAAAPTTPVIATKKKKKEVIDLTNSLIGCEHCGAHSTSHMERCSRCKKAHYCNNNGRCRIAAWYNGHQNNCTPTV